MSRKLMAARREAALLVLDLTIGLRLLCGTWKPSEANLFWPYVRVTLGARK